MGERWLPIVGYEGRYEVSDLGRVRSLTANGGWPRREPIVLKSWLTGTGRYPTISLIDAAGIGRKWKVHRLVLNAFVGTRPSAAHEAAHNNGQSQDNQASNLRWATRKANHADKKTHGTYGRKLTAAQICEIRRRRAAGERVTEIASAFNVWPQQIYQITLRQTWAWLP